MTSKQLRITSDLINSPLYKMSVGFDRLFDEMFTNPVNISANGYPPYNVAKVTDKETQETNYEITLAVAGFTQEDIDITVEDKHLKIEGRSGVLAEDVNTEVEYIHKGIAERNFQRTFRLAEHVEVKTAVLKDGILKVTLFLNVPEEAKPKKIEILS
jgi:molecular chaperone IbpA